MIAVSELEKPQNVQTHFAWVRTRLSAERTLGSWIRTAVSLIGFGFTIVQFFTKLNQMENFKSAERPMLATNIGLSLIAIGVLAMFIAILSYQRLIKYLYSGIFDDISGAELMPRHYTTITVGILVCLLGFVAFVSVIARLV